MTDRRREPAARLWRRLRSRLAVLRAGHFPRQVAPSFYPPRPMRAAPTAADDLPAAAQQESLMATSSSTSSSTSSASSSTVMRGGARDDAADDVKTTKPATDDVETKEETEAEPLPLWRLVPIDPQVPPFYHAGVPSIVIVAADTEQQARNIAAADARGENAAAWLDETLTKCKPLVAIAAGVVARQVDR